MPPVAVTVVAVTLTTTAERLGKSRGSSPKFVASELVEVMSALMRTTVGMSW